VPYHRNVRNPEYSVPYTLRPDDNPFLHFFTDICMPFGAIRSRIRGLLISNFQTARFSLGRKPAHLASACSISLARIHSRSVLNGDAKRRKTSEEGGKDRKRDAKNSVSATDCVSLDSGFVGSWLSPLGDLCRKRGIMMQAALVAFSARSRRVKCQMRGSTRPGPDPVGLGHRNRSGNCACPLWCTG
jgi:hypothetical protein